LVWTVDYTETALKELRQIDRAIARRILAFMDERIAPLNDPRSTGKPLKGNIFKGLWRYRMGDYRIICDIEDELVRVLVVTVGHRGEVYD